jgi:hypothetical protein
MLNQRFLKNKTPFFLSGMLEGLLASRLNVHAKITPKMWSHFWGPQRRLAAAGKSQHLR